MKIYIYFCLLVIVTVLIFRNLRINKIYSPFKIKVLCGCVLVAMLLRYVSLFLMLIVQNIKYLYLLKSVYFLNFMTIPIAALIILYIVIRRDKINFSYAFFISAIICVLYILLIYIFSVDINADFICGYYMNFINIEYVYVFYMVIFVLGIIVALNFYNKTIYKIGIILFIISSSVLLIECLFVLIGRGIFVTPIISDFLWMVSLNYALQKLNKVNNKTR